MLYQNNVGLQYICVFIFPRHLFGNLVFTATSVHFVQAFFDDCRFCKPLYSPVLCSIFPRMCSLKIYNRKLPPTGLQHTSVLSVLGKEKCINTAGCNLWC